MIKQLSLKNFRCFSEHELFFNRTTIMVGKNNAGKSTITEALRIISAVMSRYDVLNYYEAPSWLDLPKRTKGISPNIKGLIGNFDTIFNQYNDKEPTFLRAVFDGGASVCVYLGKDGSVFAVIEDEKSKTVLSKSQAKRINLPLVSILPQIGPLAKEEKILAKETVRRSSMLSVSSLHFRNQLAFEYGLFQSLKDLTSATWPDLRIFELSGIEGMPQVDKLSLLVQDRSFVAEVGAMGHGLQMWLQCLWFLIKSEKSGTIILDEPDVYLHADLQKKLFGLLRKREAQIIVATHSVEIISEAEPEEVLVVDRDKQTSSYAASLPGLQNIVQHIGSAHNIQITRLWASKKCVFVEGKDAKILRRFYETVFKGSSDIFGLLPIMETEGWGNWKQAFGAIRMMKNNYDEKITGYCILDSDYYIQETIDEIKNEAKRKGVEIHIWKRKELENYLLSPDVIYRVVERDSKDNRVSVDQIKEVLNSISEELKINVLDHIATEFNKINKGKSVQQANEYARSRVESVWSTFEGRTSIIPGKLALTKLTSWAQDNFKVSFSPVKLAIETRKEEIPSEIITVLTTIENSGKFGTEI